MTALADAPRIVHAVEAAAKAGKKIVVVLDDAYFGLVYEKGVHGESLFAEFAALHENVLAVKLDGCTKEDSADIGFRDDLFYDYLSGERELLSLRQGGADICRKLFADFAADQSQERY